MAIIGSVKTWANEILTDTDLNASFSTVITGVNTYAAEKAATQTISGAWTFSTAPVISAPLTIGGQLTVSTGGAAITGTAAITGALTVSLTAAITGAATVGGTLGVTGTLTGAAATFSGTVTGNLFSGSGASLTSLPAANLTGSLPAISGASLTALSATALTGTIDTARISGSYTNITAVGTLGTATITTLSAGAVTLNTSLTVANTQTTFVAFGTGAATKAASGAPFSSTGLNGPPGTTALAVTRYLLITINSVEYYIPCFNFT